MILKKKSKIRRISDLIARYYIVRVKMSLWYRWIDSSQRMGRSSGNRTTQTCATDINEDETQSHGGRMVFSTKDSCTRQLQGKKEK